MGVLGLWQILEPVGHPIKIEGLEGKRLGVDANVWLYKFIRGFREKDNSANLDAHKLGLFNRISKLLFYKIKPVFVFDGPAPVLKRRTLERRQNVRNKHLAKVQDAAMRLLAEQLKGQYPDANLDQVRIALPDLRSHNLVAAEKFTDEDRELFYLPPQTIDESELDHCTDDEDKPKPSASQIKVEDHPVYHVDTDDDEEDVKFVVPAAGQDVDIESEEFAKLPAEVRYEILVDIKEARRRIRQHVLPEDANSFSNLQMERLRARRLVQEKIEQCEKDICSMYTGECDGQSLQSYRMQSDPKSTMIYISSSKDRKPPVDNKSVNLNPNIKGIYNGETYTPHPNLSDTQQTIDISSTTIDLTESPATSYKPKKSLEVPQIRVVPRANQSISDEPPASPTLSEPSPSPSPSPSFNDSPSSVPPSPHPSRNTSSQIELENQESDADTELDEDNGKSESPEPAISIETNQVHTIDTDEDDDEIEFVVPEVTEPRREDTDIDWEDSIRLPPNFHLDEQAPHSAPSPTTETITPPKDEDESDVPTKPSQPPSSSQNELLHLIDSDDDDEPTVPSATQESDAGKRLPLFDKNLEVSSRMTNKVTHKIVEEAKELLRLFGVPYIDAAGEAEAQCALLEKLKLTEGTITDDSDVWLFGAQNVYRYFFSDDKYVMQYKMTDIEFHIRMNREALVCFAMLVGSDYTDGIMNVGPVNALEILSEFPGEDMEPLIKFKNWKEKYQASRDRVPGSRKREKLLKFRLPDEFPSRAVFEGYTRPMADTSTEEFSWGLPELDELREYARRHFGWDVRKADEKLLPVMKKLSERTTQPTIDKFFFKTAANQNPELFRSKRVNEALNKIAKVSSQSSDVVNLSESDTDGEPEEQVAKKPKTVGKRNKRQAKKAPAAAGSVATDKRRKLKKQVK